MSGLWFRMKKPAKILTLVRVLCLLLLYTATVQANELKLEKIDVNVLKGNRLQIRLGLNGEIEAPNAFAIEQPARLILDFPGVNSQLSKEQLRQNFNIGVLRRVNIIETPERIRVVLDLNESVPYEIVQQAHNVFINLGQQSHLEKIATKPFEVTSKAKKVVEHRLEGIDFQRGAQGTGRIMVELSAADLPIDLKEEGQKIYLRFLQTQLPAALEKYLDVSDFGTPIQGINLLRQGSEVLMEVTKVGISETMAYQADRRFTIEVRPVTQAEKDASDQQHFEYTGEKLSLNFQNIAIRSVLQLIADFTGLNMVASDTVTGNVTLRLKNVPWDQALDIILRTKGLAKRQMGNVLLVGPSEELAAREKLELESNRQVEELAPLQSEYIQVNYAKASDIAALLKSEKNTLLSSRGSSSVDARTNMLLVQDTSTKIEQVRALVHRLDIPIRQVLIEARVVYANDDFEEALGIRFGGALKFRPGNEPVLGLAGNRSGANAIAQGGAPSAASLIDRLAVNLPATLSSGVNPAQMALSVAKLPGGTILDLELMALEAEGLGKIISSPRLVTSNQQHAYILSGEELPFQEATSSGAAAVAFKEAVLRLDVTPQITPDNHVILDLKVNQDSKGEVTPSGEFAINKRELATKVLVANGDTVVLGGIYTQQQSNSVKRVPFLGKLPGLGWLFKSETQSNQRTELMIFVTPKIIQEGSA